MNHNIHQSLLFRWIRKPVPTNSDRNTCSEECSRRLGIWQCYTTNFQNNWPKPGIQRRHRTSLSRAHSNNGRIVSCQQNIDENNTLFCDNMTVIQVPPAREDLTLLFIRFRRVYWEKGCRSVLEPLVVEMYQLFITYGSALCLFIVAVLNDVGAYYDKSIHQNMIGCDIPGQIAFAAPEGQTEGSLLREGHVEFLAEANPECSGAESCWWKC